jgi:BioD-like phosphotransacetylase family protein
VVALFVTSLSSGAGKTAVCAGVGKHLADQGKKVGYMRPLIGAPPPGPDGLFMKEVLSLPESLEALCPSFTNESQFTAGFKKAFDAVAGGKDVVIIEGSGVVIPHAVSARVILVITYDELQDAKVTSTYMSFGQQVAGIVVNKVPVSQLPRVRNETEASFIKAGIILLGVLPEDRALVTFSIDELVKLIDGQVANNPEQTSELAANFMLGAMAVDSSLPYYSRLANKVAVVRGERLDMQLGALQTSTRAVVVTGNGPLVPLVQNRAEKKRIPLITTPYDVVTVTGRIEEAIVKTRFHQKSKMPRLMEIMAQGFNFQLLSRIAGV